MWQAVVMTAAIPAAVTSQGMRARTFMAASGPGRVGWVGRPSGCDRPGGPYEAGVL